MNKGEQVAFEHTVEGIAQLIVKMVEQLKEWERLWSVRAEQANIALLRLGRPRWWHFSKRKLKKSHEQRIITARRRNRHINRWITLLCEVLVELRRHRGGLRNAYRSLSAAAMTETHPLAPEPSQGPLDIKGLCSELAKLALASGQYLGPA